MAADDRLLDLAEGDEFAGYRIERRLGRGGMGVLYVAAEPELERRVALKLIAPEAAADTVFRRRFAEESRIAAAIEHPNVVPIYAAGEERGVAYIAMRYVSGSDLARRLARGGKLPPELAVALVAQIGNGLDAIHAAGLVHRDVKPANVLLSGEEGSEHAYITDFGVARNVSTQSGLTQTGRFVGTLDYVAPEQISGQPVDARADVYALGCLLYKLLTGEVPFPREGEAARLYAHLNEPPPAPSLFAPQVSMALDDVVIRAMSKTREDRFPSAGDLGRAAEAALHGEQPTAPERTVATGEAATVEAETAAAATARLPADPQRGEKRTRPRRLLLGGLALLVPLAVIAAIVFSGGGGDSGGGASVDERSPTTGVNRDPGASGAFTSAPLTAAQLIEQGDAICADSKRRYLKVVDPERERSADVAYAQDLVAISSPAVKRMRRLEPPPRLANAYSEYVKAQQRVNRTDVDALRASRASDPTGVDAARDRRDAEQPLRERLAREIGFTVCSTPQS